MHALRDSLEEIFSRKDLESAGEIEDLKGGGNRQSHAELLDVGAGLHEPQNFEKYVPENVLGGNARGRDKFGGENVVQNTSERGSRDAEILVQVEKISKSSCGRS